MSERRLALEGHNEIQVCIKMCGIS